MSIDVEAALRNLHEGGTVVFVIGKECMDVNAVTNLRMLFERLYRQMYQEETVITNMCKNEIKNGHEVLVMVLQKQKTEDPEE